MTQLLPLITVPFQWPVWRMEIDDLSNTLLLEIRSTEEKQAAFGSINLTDGTVNFTKFTTPERWLTGIETAYNSVLLIHNYQSAIGPNHKGLIAVDSVTGQLLWSDYTLAFDHLTINGPVVYNAQLQPKKLLLADVKTGKTIRSYQPVTDTEATNNILIPELLPAQLLTGITLPYQPYANTVHYMNHNNFRIVSLHTFLKQELKQHLYIFNNEGAIVYDDLLNTGIQKLQPEAFVIHKSNLIYLKNRSELIVLNL